MLIRILDIAFSLIAIIILFPFMVPIMIGLKLTGEHDIFYMQMRVGKGEKEFPLIKFATMLRDSPNLPGGLFTQENDPRILPFGKFLRKTKINELPQLINVLRGDMSIIGYRPQVRKQYDYFEEEEKKVLRDDKPGLSGLGAIVFRNEESLLHSIDDYEHFYKTIISPYKGKLECWYIEHRNVANYFRLIFITIRVVLYPSDKSWKKLKDLPEVPKGLQGMI